MDFDSPIGGIAPDGITDVYEAKILICYLLDCLQTPVAKKTLDEIMFSAKFINYFSYTQALKQLQATGHIRKETQDGQEAYAIQTLGQETARRLNFSLPKSVREKVVQASIAVLASLKKAHEVIADHTQTPNGYMVSCRVHDVTQDMMQLSLYAPNLLQAQLLENNFKQHTDRIYKGILALFLNDTQALRALIQEVEDES